MPLPAADRIGELYEANVVATANVLDFCVAKGVTHLIYASSQAVYGMPVESVLTEDSPCSPLEHYACSKLQGEALLKLGVGLGPAVTTLRFPGVYGVDRTSGAVYNFCLEALRQKSIHVKADFPIPYDAIHIDDLVRGIAEAVNFGGSSWTCLNISSSEECSLTILAESIAELVPGCEVVPPRVTQPVIELSAQRALKTLGWKALPRRRRLEQMLSSLAYA
jgi:UDP-glucose 4-epimerase